MREKGVTNVSDAATVTPNAMPGANGAAASTTADTEKTGATTEVTTSEVTLTEKAANGELTAGERAELERLRGVHADEQKYRREATQNHSDAEAYRRLLAGLGVDGKAKKDFDPQAAISDLNSKLESERQERLREKVARTEGVDPEDFSGKTEEEMRESAQKFKARIEARVAAEVEKRAKTIASAAAPAGEVTAAGKVEGAKQVTSRDDLKKMSRAEVIEAHKAGRLDDQISGKTT